MENKMKVEVVMLETTKAMEGMIMKYPDNQIKIINRRQYGNKLFDVGLLESAYYSCTLQHLYFVSDEEIKVGDIAYHNVFGIIKIEHGEECYYSGHKSGGSITTPWKRNIPDIKKVVATTDSSLNLPLIPKSFIAKYVESNGSINEVMVDYTFDFYPSKPVTHKDNTVIVSKVKDTWTRDEVVVLLDGLFYETLSETGHSKNEQWESYVLNWVKQNL